MPEDLSNLEMDYDNRHICCTICRIPIQSPEEKLYCCACSTIICEVCERTRQCPACSQGHKSLRRVFFVFKEEDEQDRVVKEHLEGTFLISNILAEQQHQMTQEIQMCHDVSKRLNESIAMVQGAANLAKERRADLITRQQRRVAQLNSLRALVQKKEEELRNLQQNKETE